MVTDDPDPRRRKKIALHELFHHFEFETQLDERAIGKALSRHPVRQYALPQLGRLARQLGYDITDPSEVASEIAAYFASGDHFSLVTGRSEATEWLDAYFDAAGSDSAVRWRGIRDGAPSSED